MLRVVVVVAHGDVERGQLVRQQAAADGVGPVGGAHDAAAGLSAAGAGHRVVPGSAADGAADSSGVVVVGAGRAGPLACVVCVWQ